MAQVPACRTSSAIRMRRLKSLTTLTIASRLVFAFVNRMASSSSRSGISKVVFMMRDYLSLESESTTRVFSILTPGAPKTPGTRAMSLRFGRQSCCFPGRDRRGEAPRAATTPHLPPSAHRLPDTLSSRHGPPRNDHARTNHEPDNDHASPHTPTTPPSTLIVRLYFLFFRASRKVAGSRCENRRNSPSICIAGRVLRWQVRARSMDRGVGNLAAPRHSAGSWTMSPAWIVVRGRRRDEDGRSVGDRPARPARGRRLDHANAGQR